MQGQIIARWMNNIYRQFRTICCLLAIALSLSGCVEYQTGVNFQSLNYGEVVQNIRLGEQLTSFSQAAINDWLETIESRTKKLSGKVERLADNNFKITIPFNNARDLTNKLNQYFNFPTTATQAIAIDPSQPVAGVKSHLAIEQNNFLFFVKNHLIYDIDLRSLNAKSADPKVSMPSGTDVDLSFALYSPWGSKSIDASSSSTVNINRDGQTIWQLQPGQINHVDAVFWLPNPLGIGAVIIVAISIGGYYFKYRQLPGLD